MVDERYLMQGLMQRGLPEHIAQGFVMNMRDESGLNPGINERNPIVPGSRGGFGLYQLTGPRRRSYEQFAQQRGVDFANADAQLDFLMTELQGPESRAAQSIFAAQDAPTAAAAIARDFLRPAPENLQKRLAKYTGNTGGTQMARQPQRMGQPTMTTQGQAQQPQEELPFFQRPGVGNFFDTLAMGLEGMTLNPNQGLIKGAQNRIQQRRETAQTKQQKNRTAEFLRQRGRTDLADAVESGSLDAKTAVTLAYQEPEGTYQQVRGSDLGMTGENAQRLFNVGPDGKITGIGGGGDTYNIGGQPTSPGWEAIDKKYAETWLRDSTSGLADVSNQAAQISDVLTSLESGKQFTGPLVGAQPDFVRAITNPEAQDAKDRVEQVVQRSLRETLGAQFTEAEGNRLIARAYNVNLPPEQNIARLRALFESLNATAQQKLAMREYFNKEGTLQGFSGGMNIPSVDDFIGIMDAAAPGAPQGGGAGGATHRFNPETRQVEEIQ